MTRMRKSLMPVVFAAGVAACQGSPQPSQLAGSEWRPVVVEGLDVPAGVDVFIGFRAEGELVGNGGCNSLTGSYEEDGVALEFGPLAATRMMCPDDVMQVEIELLQTLEDTGAFLREGTNLTLMAADGRVVGRFEQTDWD